MGLKCHSHAGQSLSLMLSAKMNSVAAVSKQYYSIKIYFMNPEMTGRQNKTWKATVQQDLVILGADEKMSLLTGEMRVQEDCHKSNTN